MLQDGEGRHQPRRQRRLAKPVSVDQPELLLKELPSDRARKLHQRVLSIDDLIKQQ